MLRISGLDHMRHHGSPKIGLYNPHMSLVMRKPAFCICENKDADQLHGNREADQRLCFCYTDSPIPLLPIYEISSLLSSSVAVQSGLCGTWSETPDRFSHNEAQIICADLCLCCSHMQKKGWLILFSRLF